MRAWFYDNSNLDQRELHDSGVPKTIDDLAAIGVLYWRLDGDNYQNSIEEIAKQRQYKNRDQVEQRDTPYKCREEQR